MKVGLKTREQYTKLFSDKDGVGSQLWTIAQNETSRLSEPISLWPAKSFTCKLQFSMKSCNENPSLANKVQADSRMRVFTDGGTGLEILPLVYSSTKVAVIIESLSETPLFISWVSKESVWQAVKS